jgi:serine/threonine protein kinase
MLPGQRSPLAVNSTRGDCTWGAPARRTQGDLEKRKLAARELDPTGRITPWSPDRPFQFADLQRAVSCTGEGQPYLAMEWLTGEDLAKRLARGALSLADSLTVLRRTASALAVAHQRGIVHRDLKPSNLFLRDGEVDRVTILDFGIARRREASHAITGTGGIIGAPAYMAPEQARGERDLTPAVDIFSLGCVLFECLTGERPFVAERVVAVLAMIIFSEPPGSAP